MKLQIVYNSSLSAALEKEELQEDEAVKSLIKNGILYQWGIDSNKGKINGKPKLFSSTNFILKMILDTNS